MRKIIIGKMKIKSKLKKLLGKKLVYKIKLCRLLYALKKIKSEKDFFKIHPEARGIEKYLKDPETCFDIGANYGEYTYYLSKKFPKAKIYSIEPLRNAFNILSKMIERFRLKNVFAENLAFGSEKRITQIKVENDRDAESFISEKGGEEISLQDLDSFVKEKGISKIDFMKIDVEGFEMNVLKGGRKSIKKFKPIILIEISKENLQRFGMTSKDIFNFLKNKGYFAIKQSRGRNYLFVQNEKNKS